MEKFHEKLKILRKKQGLTQQEVADFFGMKQPIYQKWESGNRKPIIQCIKNDLASYYDMNKAYNKVANRAFAIGSNLECSASI